MQDSTAGLSSAEANKIFLETGPNEIVQKSKHTLFSIFISQFKSILVILLILAAAGSLLLGELVDGIFILLIVFLNGVLGFFQEFKAEKAIAALKKMTVSKVRVVRDGEEVKIDSRELVRGDLLILEEGDKVPADCRVVSSVHLELNEAALTGESVSVAKSAEDEENNVIFLGTIVVKGRCRAEVVSTGMRTKFGMIAASLAEIEDESTPLQKKLDKLGKQLGILAIGASVAVFVLGTMQKQALIDMVLAGVSLAVASVPEGLPAVITIALAIGMSRMAKKKAILRKLSAIEALGGTTVIATDKTGTLTKNQMQVTKAWADGKSFDVNGDNFEAGGVFEKLIVAGIYCNNASVNVKKDGGVEVLGDTTEGALLLLAQKKGMRSEDVKKRGKLLEEYAFDSNLKMMSVVWEEADKEVYTKGAPEVVLERCEFIQKGSEKKKISVEDKNKIREALNEFTGEGLRVIALAYKKVEKKPMERQEAEKNLVFLGFAGISDPVRPEVKDAIKVAYEAGIRTIMVTGDNEVTAGMIARKIGLLRDGFGVMTGKELEKMSDHELAAKIGKISVFARTAPEQKLRIVRVLRSQKNVVTVTGDGVNDAPALKQADVGVAMGITGTDVAKEAADMIITDDNYSSLVTAVEEGRTIFDNIKSAVKYLIACNLGEVIAVVVGMILGWPLILTPLQLLYINLVTDGLPAIILAAKPKQDAIMKRKPRDGKSIFEKMDTVWILEISILTAMATLFAFYVGNRFDNIVLGRTLAFTSIVLIENFIFVDLWLRDGSIFQSGKLLANKVFVAVFCAPIILQIFLLYVPFLSDAFKIDEISFDQFIFVVLLSLVIVFSGEIRKSVIRNSTVRKHL